MSINRDFEPKDRISQNLLDFSKEISDLLSKDITEDEQILPFILYRLNQFGLQHQYSSKEVFQEAYCQLVLDIKAGEKILNAAISMKRKSLKIIRRHSQNRTDQKSGVKYSLSD